MHDRHAQYRVNDTLKKVRSVLGRTPDGTGIKSRKCVFFGRTVPSTTGDVDSHAKCFGAVSFLSSSPKRAEELLEVEGHGLRRVGSQKEKGSMEDRAIAVEPVKNNGDGN